MEQSQPNIIGFTHEQLRALFKGMGEKPYRADQVFKWIHQRNVADFALMTDINKNLRNKLLDSYSIAAPNIAREEIATDGTIKWLMDAGAGNYVEAVYIPESKRATLCISSQVGCMLNCRFCSTATQGFNKNLDAGEIIGQLWRAQNRLAQLPDVEHKTITNVVMMGMGEPLLNLPSVLPALEIMRDERAYGLSKRRVTVSTSGVLPGIEQLAETVDVALAVSLHAPNNKLRDEIVPINKKYPIEDLIKTCKNFLGNRAKREKITIEYVMLQGVNDSISHARELVRCVSSLPCKINLIPFNPFPGTKYKCSNPRDIKAFANEIENRGVIVTIRKTRGQDIAAACGQLVGDVKDKTKRQQRFITRLAEGKPAAA